MSPPTFSKLMSMPLGVAAAISRAPLGVLRDQLLVRSIDSYASYLPKAFDQENFHFYRTVLSGVPQQEPRWKRAVNFTTDTMGDDVSRLYVARFFPPATKAARRTIAANSVVRSTGRAATIARAIARARGSSP